MSLPTRHLLPAGMRDLLPAEAQSRRALGKRLLDHFALHGYDLVTPPLFELADVLERGLSTLDPGDVLRFVEPESGQVAALRPDVTPQIARMAASRLSDRPLPMRLCYEGTVFRRRKERARKHLQIPQAGVELLGVGGPAGDLELLRLAVGALGAAGLDRFVVDCGHADIARALVSPLPAEVAGEVLDALGRKDAGAIAGLVAGRLLEPSSQTALERLSDLHGGNEVWPEAEALLAPTPARSALGALRDLWRRAAALGLESVMRVDLGEVRGFAYYTGPIFHLFADGPGEALGSGGRYDDLLGRFGVPMHAAGFALDLDNLAWSLRAAGRQEVRVPRVLVIRAEGGLGLCDALRREGVACALAEASADPVTYARAWGFSHVLRGVAPVEVLEIASGTAESLAPAAKGASAATDAQIALGLAARLRSR